MRDDERNYLAQYLDLCDAESKKQLGYVCDVSDNGLMFVTELPIALNEEREVCVENKIGSQKTPAFSVWLKIKTLWEKPNLNPELRSIGCRILEIDAGDYQRLNTLLIDLSYDSTLEIRRTQH